MVFVAFKMGQKSGLIYKSMKKLDLLKFDNFQEPKILNNINHQYKAQLNTLTF